MKYAINYSVKRVMSIEADSVTEALAKFASSYKPVYGELLDESNIQAVPEIEL